MRDGVPFGHALQELRLPGGRRRQIHDPQPLALEERDPWLDLMKPGTMDRREVDHETWVRLQPCSDLLARRRPGVIADEWS
jgi:truncated hemoglobin YjbI